MHKANQNDFDNHALNLFREQAEKNAVYRLYLKYLGIEPETIKQVEHIPFLPIEFFKWHEVKTGTWLSSTVFESSGTTGMVRSRHLIKDVEEYQEHAKTIFEDEFGSIKGNIIIGLLPSYLERSNSSLVSMVDNFIRTSNNPASGFYLKDTDPLIKILNNKDIANKIFLFGVSFALLDFADKHQLDLGHVTLIETGGMKGHRAEIIKEELYDILEQQLGLKNIYSEYGMTELLSQAYGERGKFELPESMQVLIRDMNDPFSYIEDGRTGGINIIDLANKYSCAFIETKDLGRINHDGSFEVLGRFDNSDIRGCNLLVA